MVKRVVETGKEMDVNTSHRQTQIYVARKEKATATAMDWSKVGSDAIIYYSKYNIKETDMRIKTSSFITPQYFDLTNGVYCVLITTPQHENFAGLILNTEYDPKTGLYTYQCQDWSREYQSKTRMNTNAVPAYNIIRALITKNNLPMNPSQKQLDSWSRILAGLRPASDYNQKDWGSIVNFNPMTQSISMIANDKTHMELMRDLVYGTGAYIDIYFSDNGAIQFEPYHKLDFENTGVHIDHREVSDVKMKFDTTNIITRVGVTNSSDAMDTGKLYDNQLLTAFFGVMTSQISNVVETESSGTKSTSSGNTSNPYGNKAKKIWINSDNGSGGFKSNVISLLKQNGWEVKDGGTCSNCHYSGYFDVTSDYQVYATLYNGFCAGTIREAYSDKIQSVLNKKGVVLVVMWDTSSWTNPNGMKPYRYGDFTGYNAGRAWDDNFSSSDPSINNVASWLKSKNAKYCASPTPEGVVDQFLKGGYFASAGK